MSVKNLSADLQLTSLQTIWGALTGSLSPDGFKVTFHSKLKNELDSFWFDFCFLLLPVTSLPSRLLLLPAACEDETELPATNLAGSAADSHFHSETVGLKLAHSDVALNAAQCSWSCIYVTGQDHLFLIINNHFTHFTVQQEANLNTIYRLSRQL